MDVSITRCFSGPATLGIYSVTVSLVMYLEAEAVLTLIVFSTILIVTTCSFCCVG